MKTHQSERSKPSLKPKFPRLNLARRKSKQSDRLLNRLDRRSAS